MNKIFCFITGGHKYKSSELEVKFDDDNGIAKFTNRCSKCGKVSEVVVPQSILLRDLQKNYQELDDVLGQIEIHKEK